MGRAARDWKLKHDAIQKTNEEIQQQLQQAQQ